MEVFEVEAVIRVPEGAVAYDRPAAVFIITRIIISAIEIERAPGIPGLLARAFKSDDF